MISTQSKVNNIFELDDNQLIEKFVHGSNQLLSSQNLRLEVNGNLSQLMSRTGDSIAIMYLQNKPRTAIIKNSSNFAELINSSLIERDFVTIGDASRPGFTEYKHYVTPAGYRVWYTDPSILWKKWWPTERFHNKQRFNMDILVSLKDNWYPVQDITVHGGTFTIKTIAGQLVLKRNNKVLWLAQIMQESEAANAEIQHGVANIDAVVPDLTPQLSMRDSSANLATKIQQKQTELNSDQGWKIIKELEQKLQAQIKLCREADDKLNQAEHRAMIAEQRLEIVHKYLDRIGVNPQNVYNESQKDRGN
jgi:hypothetical protein